MSIRTTKIDSPFEDTFLRTKDQGSNVGQGVVSFTATGGTKTTGTGPAVGYTIHTFTTSGTFTYSGPAKTVDILLVGGGGGGGGGGGAVRFITGVPLPAAGGSSPVVVGDYSSPSTNTGNPSTALGYTANGGGSNPGTTSFPSGNGGVPGGGFGGLNHDSGPRVAGNGTQVDIQGNNYYWGGGGGGNGNNSPGEPGGLGGGGGGSTSNGSVGNGGGSALNTGNPGFRFAGAPGPSAPPSTGLGGANTGGGGGGGAGANGICIIRYLT